jgi:hypothetical protein
MKGNTVTNEQMIEIGALAAHYGRYPGLKTVWTEYGDGTVHFQASYLVPVDDSDTEGTFPESQWHWITPDGQSTPPE